ncbi:hypothetical protein KR044_010475 [Drosophila immigrans]|nr:hypothetical protein KR044_011173 [Drosophila immigrans]KAH8298543.1 hypothetical protein KR044_010475 [Drosophila immigrans]
MGVYSGNVEDLLSKNVGQRFSTYDQDNDQDEVNCAERLHGGWWYSNCGLT